MAARAGRAQSNTLLRRLARGRSQIEELHLGFPEQFGKAEQLAKMRRKQQVHDRRLRQPGWPVPPDEIEDEIQPL